MVNTKFAIEKRDLFTVPKDYFLCHCISADFALGAGIAKKFAEMGVKKALIESFGKGDWNGIGYTILSCCSAWRGEWNLVTKEKYNHKPTLQTLKQALEEVESHCGDIKIAMPKIGCGLDRLKWDDVEQIIKDVFADTDVEILVCDWR